MKGIITPKLANALILSKYDKKYHLTLVGSVATRGRSYNDMDILISFFQPEEVEQFMSALQDDGWLNQPAGGGQYPNAGRFLKVLGDYSVILDLYKQHFKHEAILN